MPDLGVLSERYALGELVASGGMASVYRARDEVLARTVAVKILNPKLVADDTFVERFRREALAAARMTHPNIVSIYDTGTEERADGDHHFIVMEYCGGGTLEDLMQAEGPLDPERTCAIGSAVCDALAYAHKNGVIHRDVKPQNVLLADDGTVKVSDFGIAKAAFTGKDLTTSGSLLGTVTYISPEQARGEDPDERSDIYSLGVVLYELGVGRPPFAAETPVATAMKHLQEPAAPPRSIRPGFPRDLETAILDALNKEPAERPATAEELKGRLTKSAGSETAVIRTAPADTRPPQVPQHHGDVSWVVRVLLLVGAVVLLAVGATWLLSAENEPEEGTPDGGEPATESAIDIAEASDFDPVEAGGDDSEHSSEVPRAHDGDDSTGWTTENYDAGFGGVGKSGVGLLFDLGEPSDVETIELVASAGMSVEIWAADEVPTGDHASMELIDEADAIGASESFEVDGSGRYWLVWITELPGGAGRAEISEVRFFGS